MRDLDHQFNSKRLTASGTWLDDKAISCISINIPGTVFFLISPNAAVDRPQHDICPKRTSKLSPTQARTAWSYDRFQFISLESVSNMISTKIAPTN